MVVVFVSTTPPRSVLMPPHLVNTWAFVVPTTVGIAIPAGMTVVAGMIVTVTATATVTGTNMIGMTVAMTETVTIVIGIGRIDGPLLHAAIGTLHAEGATRAAQEAPHPPDMRMEGEEEEEEERVAGEGPSCAKRPPISQTCDH
jgi:hypothetical protein